METLTLPDQTKAAAGREHFPAIASLLSSGGLLHTKQTANRTEGVDNIFSGLPNTNVRDMAGLPVWAKTLNPNVERTKLVVIQKDTFVVSGLCVTEAAT